MVACILTVSCGEDNINKILDYAENIVVSRPDSALILLDSIKNPIKVPEQQVRHILLTSYAKDLSGKDISADIMIFHAKDYLETINNPKYLALAEYYMGRIYQAQGKNDMALQLYLKAQTTAESSNDNDIKGLIRSYIGQQYYIQRKYSEAIDNFKFALEYFNKSENNYRRAVSVLNKLGNSFLIANKKDSAMIYYNDALQYAKIAQDSADIMQNRGVAYLTLNEFDNAKQQLLQSLKLNSDSTLQSLIYLNLSRIYEKEGIIDSAVYFARLAVLLEEKRNDIYSLYANYQILSRLEGKNDSCYKVMDYCKKWLECYTKIRTENVFDIQRIEIKHELDRLRSEQRSYIIIIWYSCSALMIILLVYIMHICRNKRNLKKIKLKNLVLEDILEKTQSHLDEKKKLVDLYHNTLKEIYKNVDKLSSDSKFKKIMNNDSERINEIVAHLHLIFYKNHTWDMIYNAGKSIFDKIKTLYPQLTENELKIACLDCLGFTNVMIANIVGLKQNTIQQQETKIRNKLGIEGKIAPFILKQIDSD
jgi:tetratricopeptide (TPR) repeat protein